jgi:regulatory protein
MKKITKIEKQKKRKERVSIFLNGSFFCGIPEILLKKLDLYEGKMIDEISVKNLIQEKEISEAKEKVLRLLNRRMYSEKEIRDKLHAREYEEETIEIVVQDLKEISLINDYGFASAFVSDRLRLKPEGSSKISYELMKKGISKSIIKKVFIENNVVEDDPTRALQVARKRLKTLSGVKEKEVIKRRLYNYLLRRGFSFEIIYDTLKKLL